MSDTDLRTQWRQLSPERQRALLASRRERQAAAAAVEAAEVGPEASARGPLTPSQARMHFLQSLAPESAIYHMSALVRVRGDLDLDRLIAALPAVAARQGALRTRIVEHDGVLHQEMLPVIEPDVVTHRIVASAQGVDPDWSKLLQRRSTQPFVLDRAPLWRVTIGIRSPGDVEILLTMHHIITDDWSMRVLFEDWVAAYTGIAASAAPVPYLAWATQQQDETGSARAASKREYWQRLLGAGSPALDLATDAPRPPVQRGHGALWRAELDADAVAGLRRLAASRKATLFTVLLAAWSALLSRQGTEQRIVVGVPIARRERAEHERVIGLFVDTLPVAVDVEQDIELGALVDQARDSFHGAVDNVLSLEEIILAVQPPRTRERAPVFQTMLTLHDVPPSSLGVPGLTLSPSSEELPHDTSMYDISLDVAPTLDGLELVVEYDTDLFSADHVARIGEQLRLVLRQFAENPATSVGRLDLGVGAPPVQAPLHDGTTSIPDAVLRWAEDRPDATALVCGGDRMTYADLDRAVTALARRLRRDGVESGDVVAVLVDRSVDVIVAMLGVMRAGAVYLPLDPAAPAERRRTILADSAALRALADTEERMQELRDALPAAAAVLPIRADHPTQESAVSLPSLGADAAAYLIYTSGSTGTPKGVLVPHRGLVSLSSWYVDYYDTAHNDRHLTTANHAFDASFGDYGRALLCGGALVIATREECVDPAALHRLIERERITCMETVPAIMRELARWLRADGGDLHGLETLIVGSDAWYAREITEYRRLLRPGVPIVAAYGVTEATVDSTYYDGGDAPLHPDQTVPIGHRVGNSTVVVLDETFRPVPEGVVGELAIGGNGLAFGYWRRPRATAERFLPNPFAAGERLYATGDLARLVDGEIEFLGRRDRQLKIRGFRIEPDEVELVLHGHADIVDAAVVVREAGSETAYLAAYVVLAGQDDRAPRSILSHLRERLPAYMVPTTLTVLEALPKTTSNKIDRGALPAPAETDTARRLEDYGEAVWSAEEQRIREFWQDVLDGPVPHPEANLFDLGAHSLLIPRVLHRIAQEFGTRLPLALVFEHPTVRAMAMRLAVAAPSDDQAEEAPSAAPILADLASIDAPVPVAVRSGTSRVLVTGGTGYLGAHLVSSLVARTDSEIVCLVRADDDEGARRRLAAAMTASALPDPGPRVSAIAGDVSRPGLGLSANDEAALMDGTDAIVHAAAWVNLIFPYGALRGANVLGTQEMIRLAAAHGARLHHVSTAGVADVERLGLAESRNGYLQSKWLAEQLVLRAFDQGVAGAVHRPDFLSGAVRSARCNRSDLVWALVDAGIEAGVALDLSIPLPMAPVDAVADRIVDQVVGGSTGGLFDYSHPDPIDLASLFSLVSQHGYPLRTVSPEEWLSRVEQIVADGRAAAVLPHIPFLAAMISPEAGAEASDPPASSELRSYRVPQDGYAALGVECPPIDAALLSRYLDDLTATGFLPAPPHGRRMA